MSECCNSAFTFFYNHDFRCSLGLLYLMYHVHRRCLRSLKFAHSPGVWPVPDFRCSIIDLSYNVTLNFNSMWVCNSGVAKCICGMAAPEPHPSLMHKKKDEFSIQKCKSVVHLHGFLGISGIRRGGNFLHNRRGSYMC